MGTWCLYWGRAPAALLDPDQVHIAGMTKTQTIRVIGFALILIGGALFVTARRRQRRDRRAYREHARRRQYERRLQHARTRGQNTWDREYAREGRNARGGDYGLGGQEEGNWPRRRYNWPGQRDWQRRYDLPELIHRPQEPHFRDRIRGS